MWIRLRTVLSDHPLASDRYNVRDIPINTYDELTEWMESNKEMWQLVTVETDYICNVYHPKLDTSVNVRNVYYVFE